MREHLKFPLDRFCQRLYDSLVAEPSDAVPFAGGEAEPSRARPLSLLKTEYGCKGKPLPVLRDRGSPGVVPSLRLPSNPPKDVEEVEAHGTLLPLVGGEGRGWQHRTSNHPLPRCGVPTDEPHTINDQPTGKSNDPS